MDAFTFCEWFASLNPEHQVILCLEELGALPFQSREYLANVLRAIFTRRITRGFEALYDLLIILAGGIELHELASVHVSPLINICKPVYLDDLSETDTIQIIQCALSDMMLIRKPALKVEKAYIYTQKDIPI
jgi:hypothetical protein